MQYKRGILPLMMKDWTVRNGVSVPQDGEGVWVVVGGWDAEVVGGWDAEVAGGRGVVVVGAGVLVPKNNNESETYSRLHLRTVPEDQLLYCVRC